MSEWPIVQLGRLAAQKDGAIAIGPFGSAMKANTYVSSGVPVVRGTNISDTRSWKGDWVFIPEQFADRMPRCVINAGELVFPHRGSVGEVAIIPRDSFRRYFLSTSLMKIEIDEGKADPFFVYYYFRSPAGRREILKFGSQVGTPGIGQPLSSLKKFSLPQPPFLEQRAIASILGALDDKIDLNRRISETLEGMARMIFKDWFVDFGPTRAKMEGRTPYLAPEIWSLFPARLDDEGKPEGWQKKRLGVLFDISIGRTPPRKEKHHFVEGDQGKTWLSIKTMGALQTYAFESEEDLTPEAIIRFRVPLIPAGTVLVSFKLTVGRVAIAANDMHSNEAIAHLVRCSTTPVGSEYAYCFMKGFDYDTLGNTSSIATAVNSESIRGIEMNVPDISCHRAFAELAVPIFQRIRANGEELRTLTKTRDLLLPKLMSGEISLRQAERAGEAAL